MINFVFCGQKQGFPPAYPVILNFVYRVSKNFEQSPSIDSNGESEGFLDDRAIAVWNHCIAVGLLQACLEICKLPTLITKSHMLIRLSIY
jgi:hypothetical protein